MFEFLKDIHVHISLSIGLWIIKRRQTNNVLTGKKTQIILIYENNKLNFKKM